MSLYRGRFQINRFPAQARFHRGKWYPNFSRQPPMWQVRCGFGPRFHTTMGMSVLRSGFHLMRDNLALYRRTFSAFVMCEGKAWDDSGGRSPNWRCTVRYWSFGSSYIPLPGFKQRARLLWTSVFDEYLSAFAPCAPFVYPSTIIPHAPWNRCTNIWRPMLKLVPYQSGNSF